MRRAYKKPYTPPAALARKKQNSKPSAPLVQPEWDDTIHDLTALKASPDDLRKRRLQRTSRNQMGIALLTSVRRSARSGQQERYTPSASDGSASDADSDAACSSPHSRQQQQYTHHADQQQPTGVRQHHHQQEQQQQQQQRTVAAAGPTASVLAQYADSTSESEDEQEDDVCQWQSPIRQPAHKQQQQQGRQVLHDIHNSGHTHAAAAMRHLHHHQHHHLQQQHVPVLQKRGSTLAVDAGDMQALLDKVNMLEAQLRHKEPQEQQQEQHEQEQPRGTSQLQQQLAASQQQLQATQQELRMLRDEHRQYVAHTSTLLTQLQTQVQQVLTGQHILPPLPSVQQQRQQQQGPLSLPAYSSRLQPAPFGERQGEAAAAAVGAAGLRDSSSDRLLQISSFIRERLQEQEAAAAQPGPIGSAAGLFSTGGRAEQLRDTPASSPSKRFAAGGRAAGLGASSSACGSPARRRAALQFTPAVADTVPLPSYAAMRQHSSAATAGAAARGAAAAAGDSTASWAWEQGISSSRGTAGGAAAPVGSPKRLHATAVPRPLGAEIAGRQQPQRRLGSPGAGSSSAAAVEHPAPLSLKVPPAAAARAAVWEAELSSPRPEQMQMTQESAHAFLSNASGESVQQRRQQRQQQRQQQQQAQQLPGDLAALLWDLGLASLELSKGDTATATGTATAPQPGPAAASSAAGAAGARVVLSEATAAPPAVTAPGLLTCSRGDGVLTGLQDVDRGLQDGLPRAAVSRVFTAAGRVAGDNAEEAATGGGAPRLRVLAEQLKQNMCFRDHVRAAASAAEAAADGKSGERGCFGDGQALW